RRERRPANDGLGHPRDDARVRKVLLIPGLPGRDFGLERGVPGRDALAINLEDPGPVRWLHRLDHYAGIVHAANLAKPPALGDRPPRRSVQGAGIFAAAWPWN